MCSSRTLALAVALLATAGGASGESETGAGDAGKGAVRIEAERDVVLRALRAPLPGPMKGSFDATPASGAWGVSVTLRPGVEASQALAALVRAGAVPVSISLRGEGARLDVTALPGHGPEVVAAARALPGVAAVVPWSVPVTLNDDSIWIGQSDDPVSRATPIFDHGITGT